MLDIVHLYSWNKPGKEKNSWYTKVPNNVPYDFGTVVANPFKLAMFIIPCYAKTRNGLTRWHFEDKLPKKGIHLDTQPNQRNMRTMNLLRATRGMMLFTQQYDPEWFRTPEDTAYFLGFTETRFLTYYSKYSIIRDLIFKGNLPNEYNEALEDAAFKI